jgi:hypothetical protein
MSKAIVDAPKPRSQHKPALARSEGLVRWKWALRLLAAALAAVQVWGGRFLIRPDGVSYLDLADAYLRGDWRNAISTYWSPLYSWLLAGGLALRPPPYWEFAVAKGVNCLVFLAALAAFEWFAYEAMSPRPEKSGKPAAAMLPRAVVFVFAYGLFLWSSCVLTSPAVISPDLLVSGIVYLLAASVLRMRRRRPSLAASAVFGLVLGVGCLAKAALLPLGLLFLFVSLLAVGSVRKAAVHLGVSVLFLSVVLGGWMGAMYAKSGRLTLGDVSRLNYLWLVNGVPNHGWESGDARFGQAIHPPQAAPTTPPVFAFAEPISGTFPLWYDPAYWCEGLNPRFDVREQLSAIGACIYGYYDLFSSDLLPFTAALVLLHLGVWVASPGGFRAKAAARLRSLVGDYPLLIPSLGACAMYALVVVEPRYLAGFVVLLGLALLRAVRFPNDEAPEMRRWGWTVVAVVVLAPTVWLTLRDASRAFGTSDADANANWRVAEALHRRGVEPGAVIGGIGSPFDCGWARLGRFHLGAEVRMQDAPLFWTEDAVERRAVLEAFRKAGAAAVVAQDVPMAEREWEQIAGTDYAVYFLRDGS